MSVEIQQHQGRNLLFGSISVTAGTNTLVAAPADNQRVKMVSYAVVCDAAATVKFTDNDEDLTGAMSFAANGGISASGQASSPWFAAEGGEPLKIVTTGGAVRGHFSYVIEP